MSNLLTRILTGIVFIAVIVGSLYYSVWATAALFGFFGFIGAREYAKSCSNTSWMEQGIIPLFTALFIGLSPWIGGNNLFIATASLPLLFLAIDILFTQQEPNWNQLIHRIIPFVWVAIPFGVFIYNLHLGTLDFKHSLVILVLVWTNDSFAYLTGRLLGKHPFSPLISPNKTWEGVIGGALFAGLAFALFMPESNFVLIFLAGLFIGFSSSLGDLIQSYWKRSVGIKDSGNIFPGHGGVLDRFDGFLLAAPITIFILNLIEL